MIEFVQGDLFASNWDGLVNAVNTKGVMGKGLALRNSRIVGRLCMCSIGTTAGAVPS